MNKQRIAAAAVAVGLMVTLGACTAPEETGDVNLVLWDSDLLSESNDDGSAVEESFLHAAASAYEEEHPGVTIEIVSTAGSDVAETQQFQAASIAGDGPDIRVGFTGGNTLSFSDFLIDLDGTFDEATVDEIFGWETVRDGFKSDGALRALPYGAGSYFYVFYNKALAAEAGLDLSTPPANWEELLEMGQQVLDESDATPFWVANQEGYVGAWVVAALLGGQLGTSTFTDMYNGDAPVESDDLVKAYTAYADLFADGLTNPDAGSLGNAETAPGFVQGKGVFMFAGGWENVTLTEAMGDNVGVFAVPMLASAEYPGTLAGGPSYALSITNYSEHQEEAKDFLRYLATPSVMDDYVRYFQREASNNRSADASVITNPLLKQQAEQLAAAETLVFPFDNVMPQATIDAFYRINAGVFTGQISPDEAAAQLQAAFEDDADNPSNQ